MNYFSFFVTSLKNPRLIYLGLFFLLCCMTGKAQIIRTFAGTGTPGFSGDGGPATAAKINSPYCITSDAAGNIYFSDYNNNRIRKINTAGTITTIAGTGTFGHTGDGGPATAAEIEDAWCIASNAKGDIYIADRWSYTVRRIDAATGIISNFAGNGIGGHSGDGGPATAAEFGDPWGLLVDGAGNVYIGDYVYHCIRKVNTSGIISAVAGNGSSGFGGDGGPATAATLNYTWSMALDASGNLYLSDFVSDRVRMINSSGVINTVAGVGFSGHTGDGGPAVSAELARPYSIATDFAGNLYIGDYDLSYVRKVDPGGTIRTITGLGSPGGYSGDGGPATAAAVFNPCGLYADGSQNIYISDNGNNRIRVINGRNRPPIFAGGHNQTITVCENSTFDSINKQMAITDSDFYQTETWSVLSGPVHGTVIAVDTLPSTGDTVKTHGLSYTPTSAYAGLDSFRVRVTDGQASDTTTIHVNVAALPAPITGVNNLCPGFTMPLSDTSAGGVWSSGSTGIATVGSGTGIVTSITAGTTVISYTNSNGCSATDTITVNPLPGSITGLFSVCTGNTTALTDAGGGTWTSGNTSVATIGSSTGIVTGIAAGNAGITYSLPTGCITSVTVTINPPPSAITGVASFCAGLSTTLSDATSGGVWSSSGSAIASVGSSTGVVTGVIAGTAIISYTTGAGCTVLYTVTILPSPSAITGLFSMCPGGTTTLTDAGGGVWSSGNTTIATVGSSSGIVTGIVTGHAGMTYTLPGGCLMSITVTVNPSPTGITGITTICAGSTTALSDGTAGGTWSSGSSVVATIGSSSGIVTGGSAGTTTISYTIGTGCASSTTVTVNPSPPAITGATNICLGATTVLSDGVTGGSWASSSTSIATIGSGSGSVLGTGVGTSTITYILPTGCLVTTILTVRNLPTSITGPTRVCAGSTISLSDGTGGGKWSSSATSIASVGSSSGIVSGIGWGTATVSYTVGSGCYVTTTIVVDSLPSGIKGTTVLCIGATSVLSDAGGGTWSPAVGGVATVGSSTGLVTGISGGTAGITYSLSTGCKTTVTVTINALSPITGGTSICAGQTTALTDAATGGTWSSGSAVATVGSSTGIVTGISLGTATITYILPTGCSATTTVTVRSAPPAITGPGTVCAGSTIALSDAATGGAWSTVGGVATVGTGTGVVTGMTAGAATITYALGSGCTTTTAVTVNALPKAITGSGSVCPGSTITLSDATPAGSWSTLSGNVSVGLSGDVNGVSAGTAVISYTTGSGCSVTYTVTVNDLPSVITGSTDVCVGATIHLSDLPTGGTWSTVFGAFATVNLITGAVTGVSPGTAIITYTAPGGCYATTIITVDAPPSSIFGPSNVCVGSTITLSDVSSGGTWSAPVYGGIVSVDSLTGDVTGIAGGIASVTYTTGAGCGVNKIIIVAPLSPISGVPVVCAGSVTYLSDSVTGGTWSSPGYGGIVSTGILSGAVTGVSAGTAIVTYRTPLGCVATIPVTVNALPVAGIITGPSSVCAGSTIVLTDAVTGGVWSAVNGHASVAAGSVTGVSSGVDTINYSVSNGCGTAVAVRSVTVNPIPVAGVIAGAVSLCVGSATTLTDTTAGGVWSTVSGSASVGSASGVVTGVSGGVASISYTFSSVCGTTNALHVMTINPLPNAGVIVGASTVCIGASITLSDAITGGTWIAVNGNATVVSGVVTGISAGTDTIIYETKNSCGTAATLHTVTVDPLPDAGTINGPNQVCVGASITLSDLKAGGAWSSFSGKISVGASTGIVKGLLAGSATIMYAMTNGCGTDIAYYDVTINPLPFAGAITGPRTVCVGQAISLSDTVAGGAWSATIGNVSVGSATGIVSGLTAGSDVVLYSYTNICGTAVANDTITVNPLPDAGTISGAGSVCVGASLNLADHVPGGAWLTSDFTIILGADGVVQAVTAGAAVITYEVSNVCGAADATALISILLPPVVSNMTGPAGGCVGTSITLVDTTTGGVWHSSGNGISVGATTGIVTGMAGGIDTVFYTVSNICGTASAAKVLTITPLPDAGSISGNDSVCAGDTINLTESVAGGFWSNVHADIAYLTQQANGSVHIAGVSHGMDSVVYSVTNACGSASTLLGVYVRSLSDCSKNVKADSAFDCSGNGELVIYPNPNPGIFTVNVLSDSTEQVTIVIVNMLGQRHKIAETLTNTPLEIKLGEAPGVYILSMYSPHGKCSKKFTILR